MRDWLGDLNLRMLVCATDHDNQALARREQNSSIVDLLLPV